MNGPGCCVGEDPTVRVFRSLWETQDGKPQRTFFFLLLGKLTASVRGHPQMGRGESRRPVNFLRNWQPSRHSGASRTPLELKVFVPGIKQYFFLEGERVLPLGSGWWDPGVEIWGKGLRTRE